MVDSRAKGARNELTVRDKLRSLTGLQFERTPGSGALNEVHQLKGDLYIPNEKNKYAIEVKAYADDHLTSKYITSKVPQIGTWWEQCKRQALQTNKQPLLIFKFDRSRLFVAFESENPPSFPTYMYLGKDSIYVMVLEEWVEHCKPNFVL